MAVQIHPTAVVDSAARFDHDVTIGPYSVVGPDVELGAGTVIGSHVVIEGKTTIGKNNTIYQFASIGAAPQDLKFKGEDVRLEIGDDNVMREYVTIHLGTINGNGVTKIGNGNLFMTTAHVGHDCIVGDGVVMSTGTGLSGHVVMEDGVILSGMVGIGQRVHVGKMAYVGGLSGTARDIPPYIIGKGADHIYMKGINSVGLTRKGVPKENISALKRAYRAIFLADNTVAKGCDRAMEQWGNFPEVNYFITFIKNSKNGICKTEVNRWGKQPPSGSELSE